MPQTGLVKAWTQAILSAENVEVAIEVDAVVLLLLLLEPVIGTLEVELGRTVAEMNVNCEYRVSFQDYILQYPFI